MNSVETCLIPPIAACLTVGRDAPPEAAPRLLTAAGATLIHATEAAPRQAEAALKLLRGFRAARRRLAWLDLAELFSLPGFSPSEWGSRLAEWGGVQSVVITGPGGRETAAAAREAGLPTSQAIFCSGLGTARNVVADLIRAGDAVLLLGLHKECVDKLHERLGCRVECG